MPEFAVSISGLRKSYGAFEAVAGIDIRVPVGEVFALLGPNGAGKTTTVEILEGHRQRTAGEVNVLGFDPGKGERSLKSRIGIVLQETSVEPFLTVEETIDLFRSYYPKPRPLTEIIDLVGLSAQRAQRVTKLSGGQKRRLDVAIGLAGDPDLLFLDEPTTGFDPAARRSSWQMVRGLQDIGKTIFLTTHYMDEAQHLANHVAIIVRGRIVAEGSPEELTRTVKGSTVRFRLPAPNPALLAGLPVSAAIDATEVELRTEDPTLLLYTLTQRAHEQGLELQNLTASRASLEDVYLGLVDDSGTAD